MWGAIAAAVLCLMFPVHYYTHRWRGPDEEREFKNPQYGMTRKEWKDYLIEWNDKGYRYSDRRMTSLWQTRELIPEEHFISGQWHPSNLYKNPSREGRQSDWGYWFSYHMPLADHEYVTFTRQGDSHAKSGYTIGPVFFVEWEDVNKMSWIIEFIVIGLVAGGLWIQFKDN